MTDEADNPRATMGGNKPPISEVLADTYKDLIAKIDPIAERANALAAELKGDAEKIEPATIRTEKQLATISELVLDAVDLSKKLEATRTVEKKPHLDACREVDGYFGALTTRLNRIADTFTELASGHQRAVSAEARRKADAEAAALRAKEEKLRAAADAAKRPDTAAKKQDQADELAAQAEAAEAKAASSNHELTKVKTDAGVSVGAKTEWTFKITDYEAIPLDKLRPYFKREEIEKAIRAFVKIHKGAAVLAGVHFEEDIKATIRR